MNLMETDFEIPAYLRSQTQTDRIYGTLKYIPRNKSWMIEGEPCVIELAKRLFPACDGRGAGIARFKSNKRTNGDLNWLMLRYPLQILNEKHWAKTLNETIDHVVRREQIYRSPTRVSPLRFSGELTHFQEEGLAFLLHNRRCLLADDMGLGKTVQALSFLSTTQSYPALVVVPAHLVINWLKEIPRFMTEHAQASESGHSFVHVIRGRKPYQLPPASIYMIHYHLLAWWKEELPEFNFQAVLFDEIQELRHSGTQKYSAASLLSGSCDNVIGLSGTPIYNKAGEIWNVMNIIEYHCLGDWESFTREWCTGYGSDFVQKPALLGDFLKREGLLLRRTKDQVLPELPAKRRIVQTIDFDQRKYDDLIQGAIEKAQLIDTLEDQFQRGRLTREIVEDTRQATGIAKAKYVAAFVKMLLEAGEKVLLFAYHHAVFDTYTEELQEYCPVRITGRETAREKNAAEEQFMTDQTHLVMISLRAAAGLNLQKAKVVVFGELDWSPAIHSQAEDRAHRMGQADSVLCYYLVSQTGTDEDIQEALGLKVSQFVGLMGDKSESQEDRMLSQIAAAEHIERIVQRLKRESSA
ncbi:MAG: helicase, superfamily [Bacilli bacterium]|nr:helicase, superfamily [Bacilli bacterium]